IKASNFWIHKIVEAESAMVDGAMRASETKLGRAREAMQVAEDKKNIAGEELEIIDVSKPFPNRRNTISDDDKAYLMTGLGFGVAQYPDDDITQLE
ncbi:MAG: hypothetical protein Q9192_006783, partial [Flavoplaca navasiana]